MSCPLPAPAPQPCLGAMPEQPVPGSGGLMVPDMRQEQSGGLGSQLPPCTPGRAGQVFSSRGGVLRPDGQTTSSGALISIAVGSFLCLLLVVSLVNTDSFLKLLFSQSVLQTLE